MNTRYVSLDVLATRLGLPRTFLRDQVRQRRIPYLRVGGRLRFDESAVHEALQKQAGHTFAVEEVTEQPPEKQ